MNAVETVKSAPCRTRIQASFSQIKTIAYLDSGADRTLISTNLYYQIKKRGIHFEAVPIDIKVATGTTAIQEVYQANLKIKLKERESSTRP
jgi:hypothetical protein